MAPKLIFLCAQGRDGIMTEIMKKLLSPRAEDVEIQ
jgi:hypothetical protein